jgi:hypothetical protein
METRSIETIVRERWKMSEPPANPRPPEEYRWERGWDEHEQQQLERLSRLSFAEKLAWLEEAHRLVRQLAGREEGPPDPGQ